jgi:sugar phosphate isomerase/epimerase
MYSLGVQNWTPFQQLDFAATWNVKMVHFSEIRFLGSPDWKVALDPANLRRVRARADELNIDLEIGMRSICPTSGTFEAATGSAEEQLGRMVDAAGIVRSSLVRCVLGSQADRRGPIEKHIDATVAVLRSLRSKIMDAGVKIAIENHAGDMQARELRTLVEAAGKEYVGVCIDSGNAVWTIEDPLRPGRGHQHNCRIWNTSKPAFAGRRACWRDSKAVFRIGVVSAFRHHREGRPTRFEPNRC